MPTEYPILRLRSTDRGNRIPSSRRAHFPSRIPYDRQAQRLGEIFESAAKSIPDVAQGVDLAVDPRAVAPERCLVLELIGPVAQFNVAAQSLGLEWLRVDAVSDDDEEDEAAGTDEVVPKGRFLYLTMPSKAALARLLAQWRSYSNGEEAERENKELWTIFGYLSDLRVWSVQDRLDASVKAYVENVLRGNPDRPVLVEIDLWYRTERERRDRSIRTLRQLLDQVGGTLLDLVDIPEIQYQGALVEVPAGIARELAEGHGGIALLHDVMTIRPQSAYFSQPQPQPQPQTDQPAPREAPVAPPPNRKLVATLLDGYPIEAHNALAGRLHIREVDVTAAHAPVNARFHGTAMASLVLHGDLQGDSSPTLDRLVAVIPVLTARDDGAAESTPAGKLPIGVIYRALQAIVNATPGTDPHLASTVVVKESLNKAR